MRTVSRTLLVAATVIGVGARAYGQDVPPQIDRTFEVVRQNAPMIVAWAYPTVTFGELAGCNWSGAPAGGFVLACRFGYVDDGDHDARLLRFRLNPNGTIAGIEDGGGDSVFPAFFTLRLTKGVAAAMARDELAKKSNTLSAEDRALLQMLAKSGEPEDFLSFLLNVKIVTGL